MTKVQTLWGTLVHIKSGFEKSSSKDSKKQGGGGQGDFEKNQTETDFFSGWLPLVYGVQACREDCNLYKL